MILTPEILMYPLVLDLLINLILLMLDALLELVKVEHFYLY